MNKQLGAVGALLAAGIIVVLVVLVVLAYVVPLPWTGLSSRTATGAISYKTAWDWLDLLIVPAALAVLGFWLNSREKRTELRERRMEREIAEVRAQSEVLQTYLDRMSALILDSGLAESLEGSPVRTVARARTLAAFKRLNGLGRGVVLQFLYESQLIIAKKDKDQITGGVVRLSGADLRGAEASGLNLERADLRGVDLSDASLRGVNLMAALLNGARMRGVDLGARYPLYTKKWMMSTNMFNADLHGVDLTNATVDATLDEAVLDYATLEGTDFQNSRFAKASLLGASLEGANLRDAEVEPEQLAFAGALSGATLPKGSRGLDPQRVEMNIDELVHNNCTEEQCRVVGGARGPLNVLPSKGSDCIVGMTLYLLHKRTEEDAPGLLVQGLDSGEEYISVEDWRGTLTVPTETNVAAALEVALRSPKGTKTRSLRLLFYILLDPEGKIRSSSLTCDQFLCTDSPTTS